MARRPTRDVTVGAVFALALIILAITVMAIGEGSRLFSSKAHFLVIFPNTDGLSIGSPVKIAGVQVGTVMDIRLPTDPGGSGIEVEVGVDKEYAARVRDDSRAGLRTLQYLTGEKAVEIIAGSPDKPQLAEGSLIQPDRPRELIEQVGLASENLTDITLSLKNILKAMEGTEGGLLGKMINDPEFGQQGLKAFGETLENLEALTDDIRGGKGLVGRLLYDEAMAAKLDDLATSIDTITDVVRQIDPSKGALGALLEEGGSGEQAIDSLQEATTMLRDVARRLQEGEGVLPRLLSDEALADRMTADLETTLSNAAEITRKINEGEGTLGLLVNDRTVYDGMEDVMAGVNDSKFARWLLRHYQKKGIKAESSGDPKDDEETGGDLPEREGSGEEQP